MEAEQQLGPSKNTLDSLINLNPEEEMSEQSIGSPIDQDPDYSRESEEPSSIEIDQDHERYNVARDRQRRTVRPLVRYEHSDLVSYALSSAIEEAGEEPLTFEKAMHSKDSKKWQAAMQSEMESLMKNETWTLVDKPLGKRGWAVSGYTRLRKVLGKKISLDIRLG